MSLLLSGQALLMPGFCFNRITDFVCYMWVIPVLPIPGPIYTGDDTGTTPIATDIDYIWGDIPDLTGMEYGAGDYDYGGWGEYQLNVTAFAS